MAGADFERLDVVHLKITLIGPDVDQALRMFHLTGRDARRSRIYFCELASYAGRLPLLDAGLILRLCAHDQGRNDTTVTLRPCRRSRLGPRWTALRTAGEHELRIEDHWAGKQSMLAASLTTTPSRHGIEHTLQRQGGPGEVFSPLQHEFITDCADLQPPLENLQLLGPIHVLRWTLETDNLRIAAERWIIPNTNSDLLELAVRAPPADAPLVRLALTAFVRSHDLDPHAVTTTKTRTALDHLTQQHR